MLSIRNLLGTTRIPTEGGSFQGVATDASARIILSPTMAGFALGDELHGTASNPGGVTSVFFAAVAGKTNYLSGFSITGAGATAATVVNATITGLVGATLNIRISVPAGPTVGITPIIVSLARPIPASAANTQITIGVPSFGAGNTDVAANMWGFRI